MSDTVCSKSELISEVSAATEVSLKTTKLVVNKTLELITVKLTDKVAVQLKGFGTFSTSHRNERVGRNVKTGEPLTISARDVPKFKSSTILKETVKNG